MKKFKKLFLVVPFLAITVFIASCGESAEQTTSGTTPRFDGMSLTNESPLTKLADEVYTVPQNMADGEEATEGDTSNNTEEETTPSNGEETTPESSEKTSDEEYLENHKTGDQIDVPADDMPSNGDSDFSATDIVVPSITVTPHEEQTQFYAEINSDVFISVSLVNPESYAILRFTLNGVVYQSYQFETGSTSTLLVLKVNSGSESGIKEYTIDEIKYVEDGTNEIKDAIIEGGNTVKLSVGYAVNPSVTLVNEGFDLTTYEATLGVTDPNNIIDFENKTCLVSLTDGVSIIDTKELVLGSNKIKFENLVLGQQYKYVVVANYDRLDKAGYSLHVLYEGDFNLSSYCKLSNISSTEDEISFDYRLLNKAATIKNIILFDDNNLAVDEWLSNEKTFKYLKSNTNYQIRLYYDVLIAGETQTFFDSFKVSTKAYATPTISATYTIKEAGIQFTPYVDDDNNMILSKSIKLYTQNGDFVANVEFDAGEIKNLNRNANYVLKFIYTYNLNDGNGVQTGENAIAFSTSKAVPKVEIKSVNVTENTIVFETIVSDPNQVGSITSLTIYNAETNAFITRLTNIYEREFVSLKNNTLYAIEVGYTYDFNEGEGSQVITFRKEISTSKKLPTAEIECISTIDGVDVTVNENDPDDAGSVKSISVYKGNELVKTIDEAQELYTVTGLLSGNEYNLVANYVYNLNNGTYDVTVQLKKEFKTIAKTVPTVNVKATKITTSSFSYAIDVKDPNEICTINKVVVLLGTEKVKELESFEDGLLDNLYSNNNYTFEIDYSYDLNNGSGVINDKANIKVKTLKYEDAAVEYKNMYSFATSIKFDYNIVDANNTLEITKIELLDLDGNLVKSLDDLTVREFVGLTEESFYTIKTTYKFDLNDGKGEQTNTSVIKYGTSGADIFINSLRVLGENAPSVGEEVEVQLSLDNPGEIKLTAVWIANQRCDLLNVNSKDYSNLIVSFIPETKGGLFEVEVTGYSYISGGIEVTNELTSTYKKEIVILGELAVMNYYAVSDIDVQYESYSSTPFRILEIKNEANYDILGLYFDDYFDSALTNFELIDNSHILIKEPGRSEWVNSSTHYDLKLSGIKFGLNGTTRVQKFNSIPAPQQIYDSVIHISTVEELKAINSETNNVYILDNDLDLKDENWTGLTGAGVFDGNGHTIKNLTFRVLNDASGTERYGFFKFFNGMICDLTLENIYASIQTGGVVNFGGIAIGNARCYGCMVNGVINVSAESGNVVGLVNTVSYTNYYPKNNYIEDLIINVNNKIEAAFITMNREYAYYNPVTVAGEGNYKTTSLDPSVFETYVVGNSYVYNSTSQTYSYPAYCGDVDNTCKTLVNIELSNIDYKIVTNCDINNIEFSGLAISSVDVTRDGYRVSFYDNANLEGTPIVFPYRSEEKTTIYAKWERYVEAPKNYEYIRITTYDRNKYVDGYLVRSVGPMVKDGIYIIGGYYNDLPVIGVDGMTFEEWRYDSNGEYLDWEEFRKKVLDYNITIYFDNNGFNWTNPIYAKNYYLACKYETIDILEYYDYSSGKDNVNRSRIYTTSEYYSYYKNRYEWLNVEIFNETSFVIPYAKTNDANASIKVNYIDANEILTSIRASYENPNYTMTVDANNSSIKYIDSKDTRYTMVGKNIYANVKQIVSDDYFRYVVYNDGTASIDKVLSTNVKVLDLTNLEFEIKSIPANFLSGSNVEKVILSDNIKSISDYAFYNCKELKEIVLPSHLTSIGICAFNGCKNLTNITLPDTLSSIGESAFSQSGLVSIEIPEGITKLPNCTFNSCTSLESILLPSTLKTIGADAISSCWNLRNINLPDGLERIESSGMAYSNSLKIIEVPKTVTYVGNYALAINDCTIIIHSDSSVPTGWESYWNGGNNYNTNVIYGSENKYIILSTTVYLDKYVYTDSISTKPNVGEQYSHEITDWYDNPELKGEPIIFPYEATSQYTYLYPKVSYDSTIIIYNYDGYHYNSYNTKGGTTLETAPSIGRKGYYIEGWYTSKSLEEETKVTFPFTFVGTSNNLSISLYPKYVPFDVVTSEDGKYEYYSDGDKVILSNYLGDDKVVDLSQTNITVIGTEAFRNNRNATKVILPESITSIESYAFAFCKSLQEINIPNSVKNIASYAFYSCQNLLDIIIPEGITVIPNYAFGDCYKLRSVTLPTTLKTIEEWAFNGCNALTNIDLPEGLERIDSYALQGINVLVLDVPESVKYVGYCGLNTNGVAIINHSGEEYPDNWNSDCYGQNSDKEIIYKFDANYIILAINDSNSTRVYKNAIESEPIYQYTRISGWYDNKELTGSPVEFPFVANDTITVLYPKVTYYSSIGYYSNNSTYILVSGYGEITATSEPSVTNPNGKIIEGWYTSTDYDISSRVEFPYTLTPTSGSVSVTLYPHFVSYTLQQSADSTYDYFVLDGKVYLASYYGPEVTIDLTSIENLAVIYNDAFKGNTNITSVILPNTVITIGKNAFNGCTSLQTIELGTGLIRIEENAFYSCQSLTSVTLPDSVVSIGANAFQYCYNLSSIKLSSALKDISDSAFYLCSNLRNVDLPYGLEKIGSSAFNSCRKLTSLALPDTLKSIGSSAFNGSGIKLVEVPSSVTNVDYYGLRISNGIVITHNKEYIPSGWNSDCYGNDSDSDNPTVIYDNNSTNIVLVIPSEISLTNSNVKLHYRRLDAEPTISLNDNYTITGWYTTPTYDEGTEFTNFSGYVPTEHIEYLYAKVALKAVVEINVYDNGALIYSSSQYTNLTKVTLSDIIDLYSSIGYTVSNVYLDSEFNDEISSDYVYTPVNGSNYLRVYANIN